MPSGPGGPGETTGDPDDMLCFFFSSPSELKNSLFPERVPMRGTKASKAYYTRRCFKGIGGVAVYTRSFRIPHTLAALFV